MQDVKILMITYNRPYYTNLSLTRLVETVPENAKIIVWDNNSSFETQKILKKFDGHKSIEHIVFNNSNDKLWKPTNWFWENYKNATFLSKVDDDCLMPDGWCQTLQQAHIDIPKAGIIGCWRFFPEDFYEDLATKKIFSYGDHKIMRNCWVEGSGYLMKCDVIKKVGLLKGKIKFSNKLESFTEYCIRAASKNYINGWYFPFLFQEHMDDPRSKYTILKNDNDFLKNNPLTSINMGISNLHEWLKYLRKDAYRQQVISFNPKDFISYNSKVKRKIYRLLRKRYLPLVK